MNELNEVLKYAMVFTIEFLKTYLLTSLFMEYKKKSQVLIGYVCGVSLYVIGLLIGALEFLDVLQLILIVILLAVLLKDFTKRNILMILLAWMTISVIDMFLSVFIFLGLQVTSYTYVYDNLEIPLNSISLFGIGLLVFIYHGKQKGKRIILSGRYMLLYFIGLMILSVYLAFTQFMAMGELTQSNKISVVIALNLLSIILIAAFMLLLFNVTKNDRLMEENYMRDSLLEAQKNYYTMRLQKENETRAFRHDIINHLYCMDVLLDEGKHEELKRYLADIIGETRSLKLSVNTGDDLVTAIVQDIIERYEGVDILWNGTMADNEMLSQMDICTIFYNLLKNAAEGVENRDNKNIEVSIKKVKAGTKIVIVNEADEPLSEHGRFLSHKKEAGHGYGLSNVVRCVEKNKGEFHADYENGFFHVEIILPSYEK